MPIDVRLVGKWGRIRPRDGFAFGSELANMVNMVDNSISEPWLEDGGQALRRSDLPADPVELLRQWLDCAKAADVRDANAMSLATCDAEGQPHCRLVLLKQLDAHGLGFFTNKSGRKGDQIRANARAAATFWWVTPHARQIRVEGSIRELPEADAQAYFASRSRLSQLCSAASPQSRVVKDRAELEGLVTALADRVGEGAVPRPAHWGGYALLPERVEFWQERPGRLHDRFQYSLTAGAWRIDRLAP
ncbi:MAG: pyridoxamine 5'-phosphate oxidase [Hyphomicrobiaceae bacterium]